MLIGKTQKGSSKHNKIAYIAVHQAFMHTEGHVDRNRVASIFGLTSDEAVNVFTTYSPLQLGIHIVNVPDTVEGCIMDLCRRPEFGLYDENTVNLIRNYTQMHLTHRPILKQHVPYTVAVAILCDFMITNGVRMQNPGSFYDIVGLRNVTIDSIRRIMRGHEE